MPALWAHQIEIPTVGAFRSRVPSEFSPPQLTMLFFEAPLPVCLADELLSPHTDNFRTSQTLRKLVELICEPRAESVVVIDGTGFGAFGGRASRSAVGKTSHQDMDDERAAPG